MPPYLVWGTPSQLQAPDGPLWRVLNFHLIQLGPLTSESSFCFSTPSFGHISVQVFDVKTRQ